MMAIISSIKGLIVGGSAVVKFSWHGGFQNYSVYLNRENNKKRSHNALSIAGSLNSAIFTRILFS